MANDVKLQEGHPLSENIRPIKVGGETSSLEIAKNGKGAKVTGDLECSGGSLVGTLDGNIVRVSGIEIDSNKGKYSIKYKGSEFSVAGSWYAGTILGYKMIGEDAIHDSYTLTNSFAVPDPDMTVTFKAPPSGAVEVMVQIYLDGASNRGITVGLSDNATYNSLGATYEQLTGMVDESDQYVQQHYWTITGLTPLTPYNYWLGVKVSSGSTSYLNWGGSGSGRYCDFIMKVTALPAATTDYAVYG